MEYKQVFAELKKNGFLEYGRENGVLTLLSEILNLKIVRENKTITAEISKKGGKCGLKISEDAVSFSGKPKIFEEEFNILREDCWAEYAKSLRDKEMLIDKKEISDFFKLIIIPSLLEAINIHNVKLEELENIIKSKHAHLSRFFFFIKDAAVKTDFSENKLVISVGSSRLEIKSVKARPEKTKTNYYQFFIDDLFTPGLPYIVTALSEGNENYSIKGRPEELAEMAKIIIESLYEYIMVKKV